MYNIVINKKPNYRTVFTGANKTRAVLNTKTNFIGRINKGAKGTDGVNGGTFIFNDATDNITMADTNAYKADSDLQVLLSLPTSGDNGKQVAVYGYGFGGWKIIQRAGEQIIIAGSPDATTAGVTGYLESVNQYDSAILTRIAPNVYIAFIYGCFTN